MNTGKKKLIDEIDDELFGLANGYYLDKTIPRPSFAECLTDIIIRQDEYGGSKQYIISLFNDDYKKIIESGEKGEKALPREVLGILVPLDFYLPAPEKYWASTFDLSGSDPYMVLSSIFHFDHVIGDLRIRLSYVVVAICNGLVRKIVKKSEHDVVKSDIYNLAILETNRLIGSFRALSGRHNRYLHEVTIPQLPSMIDMFCFYRDTKKEFRSMPLFAHQSPLVDCLSLSELDDNEIKELNELHLNYRENNYNVLKLLTMLNDSVNSFCFGKDSQAIIQTQSFVEYSLGFLYCECLKIEKPTRTYEECSSVYIEREGRNHFSAEYEIAKILGYVSNEDYEEFKRIVEKEKYIKSCKAERDVLIHNLFSEKKNTSQSKSAINNSGVYIMKISELVLERTEEKPMKEQIEILIRGIKTIIEAR